jgi:DNA-binding LytR/AlgR family response regulator
METGIKILVVEDEMLIGATISLFLTELGYEVTGILPRAEDALIQVAENTPDIVLLDIRLKGTMDGVELGTLLYEQYQMPVIFITANSDDSNFTRAKAARPFAFLSKPFNQQDLKRAIELAVSRMAAEDDSADPSSESGQGDFVFNDRIFIRNKEKMVKVLFQDIMYVEADRSYCRIFTPAKEYLLTMPMKQLEGKLPPERFQRIHRSYIVNLAHVEEVSEGYVLVGKKHLSLSQPLREEFLRRFNIV